MKAQERRRENTVEFVGGVGATTSGGEGLDWP